MEVLDLLFPLQSSRKSTLKKVVILGGMPFIEDPESERVLTLRLVHGLDVQVDSSLL